MSKPLNKEDLIKRIAERIRFSQKDTEKVINAFSDELGTILASGDRVVMSNLGRFETKKLAPKRWRHPDTGQEIIKDHRILPHFKPSPSLRQRVHPQSHLSYPYDFNEELSEQMATVTPGMLNALKPANVKTTCSSCKIAIPSYPGRYPKNCPNCDSSLQYGNTQPGPEVGDGEGETGVHEALEESATRVWAKRIATGELTADEAVTRIVENFVIMGAQDSDLVMLSNDMVGEVKARLKKKKTLNSFPEPVHRPGWTSSGS